MNRSTAAPAIHATVMVMCAGAFAQSSQVLHGKIHKEILCKTQFLAQSYKKLAKFQLATSGTTLWISTTPQRCLAFVICLSIRQQPCTAVMGCCQWQAAICRAPCRVGGIPVQSFICGLAWFTGFILILSCYSSLSICKSLIVLWASDFCCNQVFCGATLN